MHTETREVLLHEDFEQEFDQFPEPVANAILAHALLLRRFGPTLGRPWVDTLAGSRFSNMKELRFDVDQGVWRVAFAFDRRRRALLLVAGDKSGVAPRRFYPRLIDVADRRWSGRLDSLRNG